MHEPKTAARDLASLLRGAGHAIAFTGAGLSTEAGIPDFRSPGGLWSRNKPIPFEAFVASAEARAEAWRRKFTMDDHMKGAEPARGHRVLADWVASGHIRGIITQNIDNLHQVSGVPDDRLIELHGNGTYASCLSCATRHELDWVRERFEASGQSPACRACGGLVKSATISFGQAMPEAQMREAVAWTEKADLYIVVGSSLVVFPAAGLPASARRRGADLVIINREPTPLDDIATLVIRSDIGDVLSAAQDAL
jgi:NAD-dependent deacetylase